MSSTQPVRYPVLVMTEDRDAKLQRLHEAQLRIERAEKELDDATSVRNDLFVELHRCGIGATAMTEATKTKAKPEGLHVKHIQRIVTPPKTARRPR